MKCIGALISIYAALIWAILPPAQADELANTDRAGAATAGSSETASQKALTGQSALPPVPVLQQAPPPTAPVSTNFSRQPGYIKAPPRSVAQPVGTQAAVASTPVLWIYEFSAGWCPSCRKLSPVVEEAVKKYKGFVQYVPVDIDDNQALAKKLNIDLIPTVMVVDNSGRTLNRLVGLQQGVQIEAILNQYRDQQTASLGGPY